LADNKPKPAIGHELRHWRRSRGLTLGDVGERSGLNVGYLSQIENEKALPSLEALMSIATALDVPPAWLLLDSSRPPRLVRAKDRPRVKDPTGAQVTEVDGGAARDVRILEVEVPAGGSTGVHAHSGDEHHVILSGKWRFTQGEHVHELKPGDYLSWDASIPHDVANSGTEPGRALLIYARHNRAPTTEKP
jgi:transcriptional regulator with XRE-family HTH domain